MDEIYYEKTLNRIIQGRLRLRLGDLVLFIYEPTKDIIEESFDVYEDTRKKAYFSGVYIQDEVIQLLVENDLWTPLDDRRAKEIEDEIEDLKVEAFKSFVHKRKLAGIKRKIRNMEQKVLKLRYKKTQFDHITCDGVANFARKCWLIQRTTKTSDGEPYDFKNISISALLEIVASEEISPTTFRKIARTQPFRGMWNLSKKTGDLFGGSAIDIDKNKLALISYAQMYDNVFESPESPKDGIVEDDDCLDGWFIVQRRKYERDKKQAEIDAMITNEKIAKSDEIFVMTNKHEANEIYDLNSPMARQKVKQRSQFIEDKGEVKFGELPDVKQDMKIQGNKAGVEAIRSKFRGR